MLPKHMLSLPLNLLQIRLISDESHTLKDSDLNSVP